MRLAAPLTVSDPSHERILSEEAAHLARVIGSRAAAYLASDAGPVTSRLVQVRHREASSVYRFIVEGASFRRRLFVKQPRLRVATAEARRPLLVPATPAGLKARLEFSALVAIHQLVEQGGDRRIAAVEPVDLIDDPPAIVMEEVRHPDLRFLVRRSLSRPWSGPARGETTTAMRHAGVWLRAFHGLPFEDAQPLRGSVSELEDAAAAYVDFLEPHVGVPAVRAIGDALRQALRGIREPLRIAASHGDFALRNVLVQPNGSVASIDVLARWRTPVLEDIATFLNGMIGSRAALVAPRALVAGLTAEWETAFLEGYFAGERVVTEELRIYRALLLLDRWSAMAEALRSRPWRRRLIDRAMRRHIRAMLP